MKHKSYIFFVLMLAFLVGSCQKDEGSFDNKLYIQEKTKVGELLLKAGVNNVERTLRCGLAKPAESEINITYKVDESLVEKYNKAYYDKAIALPTANYELAEPKAKIVAGGVLSTEAIVSFKNLSELDRDKVYVLPVTIADANIDILQSARTYYYVIKGAALINVVGDIDENFLTIDWKKPEVCNNLQQLTMEALIRARNFDKQISTVMGIEGYFLIRIGDAGFPSNQIQIATNNGNFPDRDSNKGLPTNEWVHVALTYDAGNGSMIVYVNGKKQSEGVKHLGVRNLGSGGFHIGKSWDNARWLAGEIAECRIWNVVRTPEQIAENPYYVAPESEGLVAYWKFDDGAGDIVKDHTENGNHAKSNNTLKWTPVILPAPKK